MNPLKLKIIFLIFLAVTSISFAFSVSKPLTLDEVEEARMAAKINVMGPKTFLPASVGGGDEDLSHPLLYSYFNALLYKFFGGNDIVFRLGGIFWYLCSLVILLLIIRQFFPEKNKLIAAAFLGASLYLLNPLLIQHSMLVNNSDNNISTFSILLFIFLFLRFENKKGRDFVISRIILSLVVALNFMCKEITPVFLLLSVVLFRLLNREFKKLLLDIFLNIFLGVIIFSGIWYLYCLFTSTDLLAFFKFTLARKSKKVDLDFIINQFRFFFVVWKWPYYWVSSFFFALLGLSLFKRIRAFFQERKLSQIDFVVLAAVIMFIPYHFVKGSVDMMKYQYPTYPLFIIIICSLIIKVTFKEESFKKQISGSKVFLISLMTLLIGTLWYYYIGDYILLLWKPLSLKFMVNYHVPFLIVFAFFLIVFGLRNCYRAMIFSLLILIFPVNIALNLNQTADYTTCESWLNYGEKGLRNTVEFLNDNIDESKILVARKDIAYYVDFKENKNMKILPPRDIFLTANENILRALFKNAPIQYFVFDKVSSVQRAYKNIAVLLSDYFFLENKEGDFLIFKNRKLVQKD